jgi:hypothetical protein
MASMGTESPARFGADPKQQLLQMAGGFRLSACLYVAVKLGIADLVADGPRPVQALADHTGTNADALYRVLRALSSLGVFSEPEPRTIGLSATADLLRTGVPGSIHSLVLWITNPLIAHVASDLLYSVQTGKPAVEHLYHKPAFEVMAERPEIFETFNAGMTGVSAELAPAILEAYDFSGIGTLMDVAGGHGYFISRALSRYPRMKGVLLDMPTVVEGAQSALNEMGVDQRCQRVGGDIFDHIPPSADAYFMQHILHDWDDERALKILVNVRQALDGREHGRLIAVDCVIPEDSQPHPGKFLDLIMLTLPGGRERTEPEWRTLFARGGFRITRIVPTAAPESVIEAAVC